LGHDGEAGVAVAAYGFLEELGEPPQVAHLDAVLVRPDLERKE
jgi:hypothetical protein